MLVDRVLAVVRKHLRGVDSLTVVSQDALLGELGLDSLSAINLLFDVEQEFSITIPDDLLTEKTFRTVSSLAAAVSELLDGQ